MWPGLAIFHYLDKKLKYLAFLKGWFSIWLNFRTDFAKFLLYWAKVQCCEWPNVKNVILPSGHTGWEERNEKGRGSEGCKKPLWWMFSKSQALIN